MTRRSMEYYADSTRGDVIAQERFADIGDISRSLCH
jgi:hypothetical protein